MFVVQQNPIFTEMPFICFARQRSVSMPRRTIISALSFAELSMHIFLTGSYPSISHSIGRMASRRLWVNVSMESYSWHDEQWFWRLVIKHLRDSPSPAFDPLFVKIFSFYLVYWIMGLTGFNSSSVVNNLDMRAQSIFLSIIIWLLGLFDFPILKTNIEYAEDEARTAQTQEKSFFLFPWMFF